MTSPDPTRESRFEQLFAVLGDMDAAVAAVYRERGEGEVRPRFALPLIRLARLGPMTITALAAEVDRSHSALSQTIAQMRRAGLVTSEAGQDGRTRIVTLTDRGQALIHHAAEMAQVILFPFRTGDGVGALAERQLDVVGIGQGTQNIH